MHRNLILDTDSYKAAHKFMYPLDTQNLYTFQTFRRPYSMSDRRMVFFGMRYIYETVLQNRVTQEDVDNAKYFFSTHNLGKQYPWPEKQWQKIVDKYDGKLPVKIKSLRDAQTVLHNTPCYTIEAEAEFAFLATWLETSMMRLWSASTTATKSKHMLQSIAKWFDLSVDDDLRFLLYSRLHDFGSRASSSYETALYTSMGHLLSFDGTDTLPAAYKATEWNKFKPIGVSVLATEHSVMQSWIANSCEIDALKHEIHIAEPDSVIACVADTKDYKAFLQELIPQVVKSVLEKNLTLVVRPDSGHTVNNVCLGLEELGKSFGYTTNSKGYMCLNNSGVLQGDGIKPPDINRILKASIGLGWSAQCVGFGMGGGLVQDQTRDTMYAAQKLSNIKIGSATYPIMKKPVSDASKKSLPGYLSVVLEGGNPSTIPQEYLNGREDLLETIYDHGGNGYQFETFDQMKTRLSISWQNCSPQANAISDQLKTKINMVTNKYF